MDPQVQALLGNAGRALLAGRLAEARMRYEACAVPAPDRAALGLALTAWAQGDFRAVRAALAPMVAGEIPDQTFGVARALDGLALVHAGELRQGLAAQAAGLDAARAAGEGTELHVMSAITDGLVYLGRWHEARTTLESLKDEAAEAPLVSRMLARQEVAIAVLSRSPQAGHLVTAALSDARAEANELALAWALRWQGALLADHDPAAARAAYEEALQHALRSGLHLAAAEAQTGLALCQAGPERQAGLELARMYGEAAGSAIVALDAAIASGGQTERAARERLTELLTPLDADERQAYMRWPGRQPPAPAAPSAEASRGLAEALQAIATQPTLPRVLSTALSAFVAASGGERGFLLRLAGFEVTDQVVVGAAPDAYSTSLANRVMWTGEAVVVEDIEQGDPLAGATSVQQLGLRMVLGMPLVQRGEVVGVLLADGREAHAGFTPEILGLARAIADFTVVAIANVEEAERLKASEAAEAALARAARSAARARTLADALPAIAREAAGQLGAERLFVCRGPQLACDLAVGADGQPLENAVPSQGAVRWVADSGKILLVVDALTDPAVSDRPSVQKASLRSILAAPIRVDDALVGVLAMDSGSPLPERPEARHVLAGLADLVAAILERGG